MSKYNLLYETKNLINNKVYRGVHCTDNLNDGYLGSGDRLKRAILKYGKHNFRRFDIHFFESFEEAIKHERRFVDENFINRSDVYNINLGGDCPPSRKGCKMPESAKEKIRISRLGKKRTLESISKTIRFHLGSKRSEETKNKMRLSHLGKKLSFSTREKMKQSQIQRRINEGSHRN